MPSTPSQGRGGSKRGAKEEVEEGESRGRKSRECRYYARGWCRGGAACPFRHNDGEGETTGTKRREGDWDCPNCRRHIFGWRMRCICGQEKPKQEEGNQKEPSFWEKKAEKRKKDREEAEDREKKARRIAEDTKKELDKAKKDADDAHKETEKADQDCKRSTGS